MEVFKMDRKVKTCKYIVFSMPYNVHKIYNKYRARVYLVPWMALETYLTPGDTILSLSLFLLNARSLSPSVRKPHCISIKNAFYSYLRRDGSI